MFSISNDELADRETLGDTVECGQCGETHRIEYGDEVLGDGTKQKSTTLAFYKCSGATYLAGIDGKRI